jgi:exosortase/archaeosortase
MIAHQIAIRGNANAEILNSQNHRYPTISPVAVDQILAPTSTPTAFTSFIIPALTNPRVSNEIRVLLLSIPVIIVPTRVAFRHVSVYFCKTTLSFGHQSFLSASSNISIPKRIIHNHAHSIHQFIQEVISYKY